MTRKRNEGGRYSAKNSSLTMTLFAISLLIPLVGGVEAAPRRLPQPRQAPILLNEGEQMCAAFGVFAYNRAVERDQGYAISQVLHFSREYDRRQHVNPFIAEHHDAIIYAVFLDAAYTPAQARQVYETACMTTARQAQTQPRSQAVRQW